MFFRILIFSLLVTIICSCNKTNEYDMGLGLNNDNPNVRLIKNLRVNAHTIKGDSVSTGIGARQLIGQYYDEYFGKTKASLLAQFTTTSNPNFDGTPVLDSIIWSLAYTGGYYGDISATNGTQVFKVYEATRAFYADSIYYSNANPFSYTNSSNLVGTITFTPHPLDSVVISGVKSAPQLRLALSNTLGNKLLTAVSAGNLSSVFNGLVIIPDNTSQIASQGAILYFDLLNSNSTISLYYHDNSGGLEAFSGIAVTSTNQRACLFTHDYSTASFAAQLTGTANDTELVFVQSMAGVRTFVDLPFIENFKDSGKLIVNKAEIIFNIDASSNTSKYVPNEKLFLLPLDSAGHPLTITDIGELVVPYDGYYNSSTNQVKFNIGRYFQDVLNGKIKYYGLHLFSGSNVITANRMILKGKQNIIFNLTYTKL